MPDVSHSFNESIFSEITLTFKDPIRSLKELEGIDPKDIRKSELRRYPWLRVKPLVPSPPQELDIHKVSYPTFDTKSGRWMVGVRYSNTYRTRMPLARYIMMVHLKRDLLPSEEVDHINEDREDDRIENLQILTPKENKEKYHRLARTKVFKYICPCCGEEHVINIGDLRRA